VDYRALLRQVRIRPGIYFGSGDLTFDRLVAFVVGLDIGAQGGLLDGFREYLILRIGEESSLWWPGVAIRVSRPDATSRPATDEDDRMAVEDIVGLLDEFLAEFPVGRSRKRLFQEYYLWKERLHFFNLDLDRFRSSPAPDVIGLDEAAVRLGMTRAAVFDMVAAGRLTLFRSGAVLTVRQSSLTNLHNTDGEAGQR
jgi:hypothetical protein